MSLDMYRSYSADGNSLSQVNAQTPPTGFAMQPGGSRLEPQPPLVNGFAGSHHIDARALRLPLRSKAISVSASSDQLHTNARHLQLTRSDSFTGRERRTAAGKQTPSTDPVPSSQLHPASAGSMPVVPPPQFAQPAPSPSLQQRPQQAGLVTATSVPLEALSLPMSDRPDSVRSHSSGQIGRPQPARPIIALVPPHASLLRRPPTVCQNVPPLPPAAKVVHPPPLDQQHPPGTAAVVPPAAVRAEPSDRAAAVVPGRQGSDVQPFDTSRYPGIGLHHTRAILGKICMPQQAGSGSLHFCIAGVAQPISMASCRDEAPDAAAGLPGSPRRVWDDLFPSEATHTSGISGGQSMPPPTGRSQAPSRQQQQPQQQGSGTSAMVPPRPASAVQLPSSPLRHHGRAAPRYRPPLGDESRPEVRRAPSSAPPSVADGHLDGRSPSGSPVIDSGAGLPAPRLPPPGRSSHGSEASGGAAEPGSGRPMAASGGISLSAPIRFVSSSLRA